MKRSLALLLLAACTPSSTSAPSPSASVAAPPSSTIGQSNDPGLLDGELAGGPRPDENGPPEPVRVDLLPKMCAASPCSGPLARIRVFYEANGIHRYAHDGDITKCSHPPTTVFDNAGKEVGAIPLVPIQKGSQQEKDNDAKLAALFGDSKHITSWSCAGKQLTK